MNTISHEHILIVDDIPDNLRLLSGLLTTCGGFDDFVYASRIAIISR